MDVSNIAEQGRIVAGSVVYGDVSMGAIVDILLLNRVDIPLLRKRYPNCVLINQTNTRHGIQQYRLIIPDEDQYDDSYYNFLFDNLISTCSRNFQARFEHDDRFKERIRARANTSCGRINGGITVNNASRSASDAP